jgi:hypothetical protein
MKRIVMIIIIVLSSIFQVYGYHTAEISFDRGVFRASDSECSSYNKYVDYSFSSDSSHSSSFRGGMQRDKSFNSQRLYQAQSNYDTLSLNQGVRVVGFEAQIQRGELVYLGNDSEAKNALFALCEASLLQRDLPEFYRCRDFFNNQIDAINCTLNNNIAFKQEHRVTQEIRDFFKQYNYDARVLDKPFLGTYLQCYLHKQCLSIFDTLAQAQLAHSSHVLQPMHSVIADLGWAALSYNVAGKVKTASQLIQSCLMLLDCTSLIAYKSIAALSVIGDATMQTAHHINCGAQQGVDNVIAVFCDPVQFLSNCAQVIKITAEGMVHATALSFQFSAATQMAITDPDNAAMKIEAIKKQVDPVMCYIDTSVQHVVHMPAGKMLEGATAAVVEGMVWGAVGKLCKFTAKTIPVVAQAIHDGVAVGEIAITAEGIPVRISAAKVVECMEVVGQELNKTKIIETVIKQLPRNQDRLLNVIAQFKSIKLRCADILFSLDKKGLKHILSRHHPQYWDGSMKMGQTFFSKKMRVNDIIKAIDNVINQNRELLITIKDSKRFQITGIVDGIQYVLGTKNGRIAQFYPLLK